MRAHDGRAASAASLSRPMPARTEKEAGGQHGDEEQPPEEPHRARPAPPHATRPRGPRLRVRSAAPGVPAGWAGARVPRRRRSAGCAHRCAGALATVLLTSYH